jgi:hypothetical protein
MALFESAKDAIWLRNLLCEFGFCPGSAPTAIFLDNEGSIVWAKKDKLLEEGQTCCVTLPF